MIHKVNTMKKNEILKSLIDQRNRLIKDIVKIKSDGSQTLTTSHNLINSKENLISVRNDRDALSINTLMVQCHQFNWHS